jgi:Xaa-Pro aminopeptidase
MSEWRLDADQITQNIKKVQSYLDDDSAFYIPPSDIYLSEYVPLQDCYRYYVTGFTGSTSELLITRNRVFLFLDGRYHEQGEKEAHPLVTAVNVDFGQSLLNSLKERLHTNNIREVKLIAERTSLSFVNALKDSYEIRPFSDQHFRDDLGISYSPDLPKPYLLDLAETGFSTEQKLETIFNDDFKASYFIGALDQVSWLTNTRGFHAPFQSFFNAKALVTKSKIYLFSNNDFPWDESLNQDGLIKMCSFEDLEPILTTLSSTGEIHNIFFDQKNMTYENYLILEGVPGLNFEQGSLLPYQMVKNSTEIQQMKDSFMNSNRAIAESLKWVSNKTDGKTSELDFFKYVNKTYKKHGAVDLSFNTIAAVDENSSVIHFSDSSCDKKVKNGSIILLDSGAHYHCGMATDTTRSIVVGEIRNNDLKQYYTLVLKGLIASEKAIFPDGTIGAQIDSLARNPMRRFGYDYAHGTGHGVGVNVHEGGFSISSKSTVPLIESLVGSLEPGLYVPGVGGIRLENIVVVKKHPTFEGMLCFEPLTWIGYDYQLIDESLLTSEEKDYLTHYEQECERRGTSYNWSLSSFYQPA